MLEHDSELNYTREPPPAGNPPARLAALRPYLGRLGLAALSLALIAVLVWKLVPGGSATPRHPGAVNVIGSNTTYAGALFLNTNVNWATVRVNGVAQDLTRNSDQIGLVNGPNTIVVSAPPFQPRTCLIHWPTQRADSCLHGESLVANFLPRDLPTTSATALAASLSDWLAPQYAALRATVAPGDAYATSMSGTTITTVSAHQALTATLVPVPLDAPTFACDAGLCAAAQTPRGAGRLWNVFANFQAHWRYTDASGAAVAEPQTPVFASEFLITVHLTTDATGTPAFSFADDQGATDLAQIIQHRLAAVAADLCQSEIVGSFLIGGYSGGSSVASPNLAACAVTLSTTGTPVIAERFGALYAGNAAAHQAYPTLPLAPADLLAALASS